MSVEYVRRGWEDRCLLIRCDAIGCSADLDSGMWNAGDAAHLMRLKGWTFTKEAPKRRRGRQAAVYRHFCPAHRNNN